MDNYNYDENDDTIEKVSPNTSDLSGASQQPYIPGQQFPPNMPYQPPYMQGQQPYGQNVQQPQGQPYQQGQQPYTPNQQYSQMPYMQNQPYQPPYMQGQQPYMQNQPFPPNMPYPQYYPVQPKKNNTFAIISLICGLLSIVTVATVWFSIIFSIVAIVCAIISRVNSGRFEGASIAGLAIGIIFLLISLLIFFMALALLQDPEFLEEINRMLEEYNNSGYKYYDHDSDHIIKILANRLFKI